MRFTITPLGGAKRPLRQIVAGIVEYLAPKDTPAAGTDATGAAPAGGPSRYYADRGDLPGRWLGRGAADLDLTGKVDREEFALVLMGRDPRTGARLITAQGSAGRRPRLGVGTETRWDGDGDGIYDERDTAAALDLEPSEIGELLDAGTRLAAVRLFKVLGAAFPPTDPAHSDDGAGVPTGRSAVPGTPTARPGIPGSRPGNSYLVPVVDADGHQWVTEAELVRFEDARAAGVSPEDISAAGAPDDLVKLADAARLVDVTPRYLRGVARYYEDNQALIDQLLATGDHPRQAYLIAHRDPQNRWLVTRSDLADFVARRRPPAVRAGYDLTLTTEKSLSVLALLSDPATTREVLDAIEEANDWALGWLEVHSAAARIKGETVPVDGWTVGSFRHLTSRALDPFAHWHNVVPNTVNASDGTRRALDARGLYRDAKAAGALATAQARWRITISLGARWRPGRKTGWEIAGIADDVLTAFSQRRNEVDDALRELEEAIGRGARPDEVEQVVLQTRPAKQDADIEGLRAEWWARAEALGLRPDDLAACLGHTTPLAEPDPEWIYEQLAGAEGICQNLSIFDYGDLLATLCNLPIPQHDDAGESPQPLLVTAERLEQLARGFLASPHVVALPTNDHSEPTYTTREILTVQERVATRFAAGLRQDAAAVPRTIIDDAIARHPHLTREQRRLVHRLCTSGHTIQCTIGYPGAGKTTTMAAAREAWEAAGYRVVGAAVKGEAARLLGDATGMPTETLAWWLAHQDPHTVALDARTVLVVDEASTISDRDLDRLGWLCDQTGTTLRLVGDPHQHGAVEAGGMFRVLCVHHDTETPQLTQTHRVRDPHDRAAAHALRQGEIDKALDHLQAGGHLHILDNEFDFYRHALARWWSAHQAGHHHPMVDGRNVVRCRLNRLAHGLLKAAGHVGTDELAATGDRRFSIGDRVIARSPARDLYPTGQPAGYVRNGAVGTITRIHRADHPDDDTLTVAFDGIGAIELPRSYFDEHHSVRSHVGLDYAYAVTSYAVQGSTSTLSTSRIDQRSTRAETLVDITRGQHANHLYLTATNDDPLEGETLPRTPPPPVDETITARLRRSRGEITAWEILHPHDHNQDGPERRPTAIGI